MDQDYYEDCFTKENQLGIECKSVSVNRVSIRSHVTGDVGVPTLAKTDPTSASRACCSALHAVECGPLRAWHARLTASLACTVVTFGALS